MEFSLINIVYIGVFFGVSILGYMIVLLLTRKAITHHNQNRRLQEHDTADRSGGTSSWEHSVSTKGRSPEPSRFLTVFERSIRSAGYEFSPDKLPIAMLVTALVVFVAASLSGLNFWLTASFAALSAGIPLLVLRIKAKRRLKAASRQLPEVMDIIARSLSAGHPVPAALVLVAKEFSDPLGSEFAIVSNEITYGLPVSEAIDRLAERMQHPDFQLMAAMIGVQASTGGNLVEILNSSAKMIRERQKIQLKIKAASAEARISVLILSLTSPALFLLLMLISPDYYGEALDSDFVRRGLLLTAGWMALGHIMIRRFLNVRI